METHFPWDREGEWNRDRNTQKVHEISANYLRSCPPNLNSRRNTGGQTARPQGLWEFSPRRKRPVTAFFLLLFISWGFMHFMNQNTRRCRGPASAFPPAQFLALCSTYRLPAPRRHRGAAASVSAQPNRFGTWGPEGGNPFIPLLPPRGVPLPLVPGPPLPLPGTERLPRPVPSRPVPGAAPPAHGRQKNS